MSIAPTTAIAEVALGFAFFAYWVFRPVRRSDEPGPHNGWKRTQGGVQSGFHEGHSDPGCGDSGGDGGSD